MASPPPGRFVLAIDQGTTSSRCILFDHVGAVASVSQREHRQYFPHSAYVEHDASEIWENVASCVRDALASAQATVADVVAVGVTVQRETVVVWDAASGAPLHHALVWQDQRGAALCEELAAAHPAGRDRFRAATGLPLVPYFSASKLRWLLDHVPGLRARAEDGSALCGTMDAYLAWRLTGGAAHVTDVSNASRTLLMNIHTLSWDAELCAAWGVPMRWLPAIRPSSAVLGACAAGSPLPGVPLAGMLGDQQAALFGQGCFAPGDAKNTYGTGCFLLMNTGAAPVTSQAGLLATVAYQLEGQPPVYALEGSVAVAGAVVSWLRDNLAIVDSPAAAEQLAGSVPDSGDVVFVPAFNGLFAPHWHSQARGLIIGLSGHTTKAHIARAAIESVAFQSKELLDAMQADALRVAGALGVAGAPLPALRVDGGMTANEALMQLQADVTGRVVVRPVVAETTALGAAYAAGLAVGFWRDTQELRAHWRASREWRPAMPAQRVSELMRRWDSAVARSRDWAPLQAAPDAAQGEAPAAKTTPLSGGFAAAILAGVAMGAAATMLVVRARRA